MAEKASPSLKSVIPFLQVQHFEKPNEYRVSFNESEYQVTQGNTDSHGLSGLTCDPSVDKKVAYL